MPRKGYRTGAERTPTERAGDAKRCANGKRAMTREERNARRRVGNISEFAAAMQRRTRRRWREAHAEEINARRRAYYAEHREEMRAKQKAWRDAHPETKRKSWQNWAKKNKEKLREKDRKRAQNPEYVRRKVARMKERRQTDPEYAARVRAQKRAKYRRDKERAAGLRWRLKFLWIPKWERIVAEGEERMAKYLMRAGEETCHYFHLWHGRDPYGVIQAILDGKGVTCKVDKQRRKHGKGDVHPEGEGAAAGAQGAEGEGGAGEAGERRAETAEGDECERGEVSAADSGGAGEV